jgi:hypothetical protein
MSRRRWTNISVGGQNSGSWNGKLEETIKKKEGLGKPLSKGIP